ncbi:diguanylate cyclase (GGDEF) domain-containing protein [Treponema socranskii subsp. paredis ATCC 35535]|nr:diguanylate cyclase (GGDEF) domain-containing protein [Treponema socranskii subsp. paredis ATCC 35535]
MLFTYVVSYFCVAVICLAIASVIATKLTSDVGSESEMRAFRGVISGYAVFLITNSVWIWCNHGYLPSSWGKALSIMNIISISVCAFFWFQYTELKLQSPLWQSKYFHYLYPLPMCIIILLAFASSFTGWLFYYDADGKYVRGPLYALQLVFDISYLLFASVHALIAWRQTKIATKKKEYFTLIAFLFCPLAAGIVDKIIPDLPVLEMAMLFAVFIVFSNLQESQIYRDALTGLNNRRLADERLLNKLASVSESRPLYFFIADINSFKHINDTYGHLEGDRALKIIAETFQEIGRTYHSFIARWGGDEFIIIAEAQHIPEPDQFIAAIRNTLAEKSEKLNLPYELKISIGYSKCTTPEECASSLIGKADDMLYADKKTYYRTRKQLRR